MFNLHQPPYIFVIGLWLVFFWACQEKRDPDGSFTKLEIKTLQHQNIMRKYTVHLPDSYDGLEKQPLVVVLHGGGGTMENTQSFTEMNRFSDLNGFVVVYPEGFGRVQNGFSWADGRNTVADQEGIDDLGFLNKMLDHLLNDYSLDPERFYVCGFSNGGFMTQRLACEMNDRFAAMGSLGSIMDIDLIKECKPKRAVPMFLLTGTDDPFVPINGGPMIGYGDVKDIVSMEELVTFWVANNSCIPNGKVQQLPDLVGNDQSTVTVFKYSGCDCNADVAYYRIEGGGHTWPGVSLPVYELIAGPTNRDIHASEELWRFFNEKRLCP